MRKTLCALAVGAVTLALAAPALAKVSIESATIEGEGLATPIKFGKKNAQALNLFITQSAATDALYRTEYGYQIKTAPASPAELGPRYEVTMTTFSHGPIEPVTFTLDLYPFAPDGPWFQIPPGQEKAVGQVAGRWHQAPAVLRDNLISWGIPEPSPPISSPQDVRSPSEFPILGVTALLAGLLLLGAASTLIMRRRTTQTARTT